MHLEMNTDWLAKTLNGLTIEQKIGQLLHPNIRPQMSAQEIAELFEGIEPGGVFIFPGTFEETEKCTQAIQQLTKVPVIFSSDMENGPGRMIKDATKFPDFMAIAAVDDDDLTYEMGRAAAIEGRSCGLHWTFSPIVDINTNWRNPITNTRGLGDNPERISRLARRFIAGCQDHGLAATAKHFPGDGYDERDQHVCTTVNPLSKDEWLAQSGRMFKETIYDDVWSIMIGHIALPSCDPGNENGASETAPPATLSRKLTTDLLRGELGFKGMVVSDATRMGGLNSWGPRSEIVPQLVNAGNDQVLFADLKPDYDHLMRAYEDGRLSEERIDEAVEKILWLKMKVGLDKNLENNKLTAEQKSVFEQSAKATAERAPTLVTDRCNALPLDLSKGKRIFSVHLLGDPLYNVNAVDDILRKQGADVTTYNETPGVASHHGGEDNIWPSDEEIEAYDAILVHVVFGPSWCTNRIRPTGNGLRFIIDKIPMYSNRTVFISYGSPYVLKDLPRIPLLLNAYSPDPLTQQAVVDILSGRLKPTGKSPVTL
jgi:beta-N-acetylhexosaminidase